MANMAQMLRANRSDSIAPRPATAQATAPPGVANQEFTGRVGLKGASKIRLDRIIPDPDQPRKTFDPEPLARLAENIRIRGQLVPGLVRWSKEHEKYIIIDGERRFRATQMAKATEFACVVEDESDPAEILELQLITNALREEVPPVEQARAWERLMASRGYTLRQLGDVLGIDHSTVGKSLDLLRLPESVQAQVDAGQIAASTAGLVAKLPEADQLAVADRIVDEGLSRAQASAIVRDVAAKRTRTASKPEGKARPKPATTRTWKRPGGLRIEATRAKGLDVLELIEALRAAALELEAEQVSATQDA